MKYFFYIKDFANRWRPQTSIGKPYIKTAEGAKRTILGPIALQGAHNDYSLDMLSKVFPIENGEIKPPESYNAPD